MKSIRALTSQAENKENDSIMHGGRTWCIRAGRFDYARLAIEFLPAFGAAVESIRANLVHSSGTIRLRTFFSSSLVRASGTIQILSIPEIETAKEISLSTSLSMGKLTCRRIVGRYWASAFWAQVAQF
ncbi:hypothetical protein SDJN03_13240, partial [Cucurbita argyrosperma subsp. sororia]